MTADKAIALEAIATIYSMQDIRISNQEAYSVYKTLQRLAPVKRVDEGLRVAKDGSATTSDNQ